MRFLYHLIFSYIGTHFSLRCLIKPLIVVGLAITLSVSAAMVSPMLQACSRENQHEHNYILKYNENGDCHSRPLVYFNVYQHRLDRLTVLIKSYYDLFDRCEYCHYLQQKGDRRSTPERQLRHTGEKVTPQQNQPGQQLKRSNSLLSLARTLSASVLAN